MSDLWPEVTIALNEKRRELVIKGNSDICNRFEKNNGSIPDEIFHLKLLNFLEIASCGLKKVGSSINQLSSLTQLLFNNNELLELPKGICSLSQLKILDVSYNQLNQLPEEMGLLKNLQTLNVSYNKLESFPESGSELSALSVLNISGNNLQSFPSAIFSEPVCKQVSDLNISHNSIDYLEDEIGNMVSLKQLDISDNKIKEWPQSLAKLLKLKIANYKENPLKDRRLKKLVENGGSQKSIMDYIRAKGRPTKSENNEKASAKSKGKMTKRMQKQSNQVEADKIDIIKYRIEVLKITEEDENLDSSTDSNHSSLLSVIVKNAVKDVRPYIVACVIKNLNLKGKNFKLFISLQTELHDSICSRRTVATIATHDFNFFEKSSSIYYDARPPSLIKIHPLGRVKEVSGTRLFQSLKKEAEEIRKQKKRNQATGIHKYLTLLEGKELFPCLLVRNQSVTVDEKTKEEIVSFKEEVISLPPLTNGNGSKITEDSKNIFMEVTSSKSLADCKLVMDTILKRMVEANLVSLKESDFYSDSSDEDDKIKKHEDKLLVQQVKIIDENGKLKVLYPSKTDLIFSKDDGIKIDRPY